MAYNPENTPTHLSAQKLMIVFERIFLETVLAWDNPLAYHDSCHGCRSPYPVNSTKVAVCDRCEATYHMQCLDPPLSTPPRSEWYCSACVEQKGVASVHPHKTSQVRHPDDPEGVGEVVGIEQIKDTLMFVVEFGGQRELWNGKKIRQYTISSHVGSPVVVADKGGVERREGGAGGEGIKIEGNAQDGFQAAATTITTTPTPATTTANSGSSSGSSADEPAHETAIPPATIATAATTATIATSTATTIPTPTPCTYPASSIAIGPGSTLGINAVTASQSVSPDGVQPMNEGPIIGPIVGAPDTLEHSYFLQR